MSQPIAQQLVFPLEGRVWALRRRARSGGEGQGRKESQEALTSECVGLAEEWDAIVEHDAANVGFDLEAKPWEAFPLTSSEWVRHMRSTSLRPIHEPLRQSRRKDPACGLGWCP